MSNMSLLRNVKYVAILVTLVTNLVKNFSIDA